MWIVKDFSLMRETDMRVLTLEVFLTSEFEPIWRGTIALADGASSTICDFRLPTGFAQVSMASFMLENLAGVTSEDLGDSLMCEFLAKWADRLTKMLHGSEEKTRA
jgi:hypothetical protein